MVVRIIITRTSTVAWWRPPGRMTIGFYETHASTDRPSTGWTGVWGGKHIVQVDNAFNVYVYIYIQYLYTRITCTKINDIFTGSRARPLNRPSVSVSPIFTRCHRPPPIVPLPLVEFFFNILFRFFVFSP